MKREQYLALLGQLPILNATYEDMARMCPHLSIEQALKAFLGGQYVACPPVALNDSFQILHYSKESRSIQYAYTGRMGREIEHAYRKKAIQFAQNNWGAELQAPYGTNFLSFRMEDPSKLDERGYPTYVTTVHTVINREYNDLINDHSEPESTLLDKAIIEIVSNPFVWKELESRGGSYSQNNCAYCGYGLSLKNCAGCGHSFKDNFVRTGGPTPIPKKVHDALISSGFTFTQDIALAWEKERSDFEQAKTRATERGERASF